MQPHTILAMKTLVALLLVAISNSVDPFIIDRQKSANLQSLSYVVEQLSVNGAVEYRFKLDNRHFSTLIDQGGALAFRPHPGCDINGWGTTWYPQPFLPGAVLKHTTIGAANADSSGIHVNASGLVSRSTSDTYGTWNSVINFTYDPIGQVVAGVGQYTITLAGPLSSATGDLNLYKIASNYLDSVPLLSGGIGDTGDMLRADIGRHGLDTTWVPPNQPAHFPTDKSDFLSINVIGRVNLVDTQGMGYAFTIAPAFKPSLRVDLTSQLANADMMFGGSYDLAQSQSFEADNVGITPLIAKTSSKTVFYFDVVLASAASEACRYLPLMAK